MSLRAVLWSGFALKHDRASTRWAVVASASRYGLCLTLTEQRKWTDDPASGWGDGGLYYGASLTRHFDLGADHAYYDGPHCSFSIGPLHLVRGGHDCAKCMEAG